MNNSGISDRQILARNRLYRAASFVSISLGANIFGAGFDPLALLNNPVPLGISILAAICFGAFGLTFGGLKGMILFVLGNILLGSAIFGSAIPSWLYAMGVLVFMPGLVYRIFCPA